MKMKPIPCRFEEKEEKEEKLLRDEAARRGVTPLEFIRRMVAKGLMAVTLEETISDLRSFSANQATGLTTDEFVFLRQTFSKSETYFASFQRKISRLL